MRERLSLHTIIDFGVFMNLLDVPHSHIRCMVFVQCIWLALAAVPPAVPAFYRFIMTPYFFGRYNSELLVTVFTNTRDGFFLLHV